MFGLFSLLYLLVISVCFLDSTVEAIVGGFPFGGNAYSYAVSVQIQGHGHVCGGGIISDRFVDELFVLTAAHCVLNRDRQLRSRHISVLAGTKNLNETDPPAVIAQVEKVYFPKEFHPTIQFPYGDIAVLKLKKALRLENLILAPEVPQNHHSNYSQLAVAGFGWYRFLSIENNPFRNVDGRLRYAMPLMVSDEDCERAYPPGAIEISKHICVRMRLENDNHRYGVCHGDTGNILTSSQYVIGVLSRISRQCDERRQPAIYTRVTDYVMMINNIVDRGHDPQMVQLLT